jgi:DNA-directed RNA polymerase III subunit RPC6
MARSKKLVYNLLSFLHAASNHTSKIPSFGAALWNSDAIGNDGSEEDEDPRNAKKRKHQSDDSEEDKASKKKKHKDLTSEESDSSEDNSSRKKSKRKRSKSKYEFDADQDQEQAKKKKKKKKHKKNDPDPKSSSSDDTSRKKRGKSDLSSDSDSDSETDYRKNSKSKSTKHSQLEAIGFDDLYTSAGNSVYRALKESTIPFAWTESPCGVCPSFEFCKPGGPVNPQECVYYGDWLSGGTVSNEIEE